VTTGATKLYGLVLAGGQSTRMGTDKSVMDWHGKEQRYYVADLLQEYCDDVFISCRAEQQQGIDDSYKTITDSVEGKGPIVGILSAFEQYNDVAWVVVACDLPLVNAETIYQLIAARDMSKTATTYKSPHDGLPEPLITIWEPKSKKILEEFKDKGYNCPRKVLINSDVLIIDVQDEDALINTNTPQDAEKVKQIIAGL
jgi:molybdopterin-guanine dinucleotide biosynthesis protein A